MKITFVIGVMGNGGAERVIANLSNEFVLYGWDVNIITIYGSRQDYELDKKVSVRTIICKCPVRLLRPFERILTIRKHIKEENPDVVISFLADVNIHVILSMFGSQRNLIVSERNDPRRDPNSKWVRWLRDRLYARADGIVFQTKDAEAYFDKLLKKRIRTAIIPNPIKDNLPIYNKTTESNQFITACRLNKQKNLPLMIDALKILIDNGIDAQLSIYGEGPEKKNLEAYIDSLGISNKISLCGFTNDIHEKMRDAACFVISSDYEGISNSMIEALAIGIPVVATDCPVGGARMYIKDGVSGRIVPCGDKKAFAEAMQAAITDRKKAVEWGENASHIRECLKAKDVAIMWREFIEKS